jgi:CheY-like chemotaxis protein
MNHLTDPFHCHPECAVDLGRSGAHVPPRRVSVRTPAAPLDAPRLTDPRLTAPRLFAAVHVDAQPADRDRQQDPGTRECRPPGKPHVLHVDSDDRCAEMVAGLLAPEVHVTRVSTLTDARRAIANDVYSLVILDPYLPDGNGAMLVSQLCETPVLLHSEKSPAWQDRVDGYLPKPWSTHRAMWLAVADLLGLRGDLVAEG